MIPDAVSRQEFIRIFLSLVEKVSTPSQLLENSIDESLLIGLCFLSKWSAILGADMAKQAAHLNKEDRSSSHPLASKSKANANVSFSDNRVSAKQQRSLQRQANKQSQPAIVHQMKTPRAKQDQAESENYAPVMQRYSKHGDFLVSENQKFAVKGHGKPQSNMYVESDSVDSVTKLQHVVFEQGDQVSIDTSDYITLNPRYKSPQDKRKMEKMYCGEFARHVSSSDEFVSSETATKGQSLYMKTQGPASYWENHYAPVIIADGGDRGTFETAVGLNHIFFGIYGQAVEQSFKFKTEIAGMALGLESDRDLQFLTFRRDQMLQKNENVDNINSDIKKKEEELKLARQLVNAVNDVNPNKWGSTEREKAESVMQNIAEYDEERKRLEEQERQEAKSERERKERNKKWVRIGVVTGLVVIGLIVLLALLL